MTRRFSVSIHSQTLLAERFVQTGRTPEKRGHLSAARASLGCGGCSKRNGWERRTGKKVTCGPFIMLKEYRMREERRGSLMIWLPVDSGSPAIDTWGRRTMYPASCHSPRIIGINKTKKREEKPLSTVDRATYVRRNACAIAVGRRLSTAIKTG